MPTQLLRAIFQQKLVARARVRRRGAVAVRTERAATRSYVRLAPTSTP